MNKLTTVVEEISTNGRWGLVVVGPEGTDFPARGKLTSLGQIEGKLTYEFSPSEDGDWIFARGDVEPLAGCKVLERVSLQSNSVASLLAGGEVTVFKEYGYKRRSSRVVVYIDGQPVDIPAAVLAAQGFIPTEREEVDTTPPPMEGALALALREVLAKNQG